MSIEIDWDALTTGSEGEALAESIRAFIHAKFQEVSLPKFIRAVEVHAFAFGDACPSVVIKDICDPLPDFYEDGDDDDDDEEEDGDDDEKRHDQTPMEHGGLSTGAGESTAPSALAHRPAHPPPPAASALLDRRERDPRLQLDARPLPHMPHFPSISSPPLPRLQSSGSLAEQLASPLLSRSSTPRIPGGTSSLSYFHLPLAGRIQGATGVQSPMSAVAGWQAHQAELYAQRMGTFAAHLPDANGPTSSRFTQQASDAAAAATPGGLSDADPSTRPSTAHSHDDEDSPHAADFHQRRDGIPPQSPPPRTLPAPAEPDPNDLQIVLHISYKGNIRLSLTAEILLDYPMPSFVGIPLKLNITGLSFDGVALLALLQNTSSTASARGTTNEKHADDPEDEAGGDRRAHFCFLGQEDAETLVGAENLLNADENGVSMRPGGARVRPGGREHDHGELGSLLREINVESEIGKTKDGRQNLKNVGKVEKFVLEQVRRIFEDEFVYPSFWTFLV